MEKRAKAKAAAAKGKPLRHQLHRKPTSTQQARWEAVQQAKSRGLSLRAIARELGMAKNTVGKYLKAESPPTKLLSSKERAKAEALVLAQSMIGKGLEDLLGPGALDVDESGGWLTSEFMRLWMVKSEGWLFGAGWRIDHPGR